MAYDDPIYRPQDPDHAERFGAAARHRASAPDAVPEASGPAADTCEPASAASGRDRIAVHVAWETVLLVAVAVVAYLLYRDHPAAVRGAELDSLLVFGAALGLLVLGAGLSLRASAPNLAVGPVAIASALHLAENGDRGVLPAMLPAVVAVVATGLVVAILVVGLHVPGWAASLAAGMGAIVFIQQRSGPVDVQGDFDPTQASIYLFGGFVALAVLGGVFGSIGAVRRVVGRFRPVGDPAQRAGGLAALFTGTAIVVSMLFAMTAGALLGTGGDGSVAPTPGIEWTGLALGIALFGGTSAFGRRGGVLGTILGVVLVTLLGAYADGQGWDVSPYAVAGGALAAGLVVTRLVESYGRPRSAVVVSAPPVVGADDRDDRGWGTYPTERPDSWSAVLPAQPVGSRDESWRTDRWDTTDR
ncbi:ABC transporter permease [Micromonospora sp. NPDC003197]